MGKEGAVLEIQTFSFLRINQIFSFCSSYTLLPQWELRNYICFVLLNIYLFLLICDIFPPNHFLSIVLAG